MERILLVNLEGNIGGAESSLLLLVKYLKDKFIITTATSKPSPLSAALDSLYIQSYNLPKRINHSYRSLTGSLSYWLKTTRELIKIIRKVKPDIVHANSIYAGLPVALATLITRKRMLLHVRDIAGAGFVAGFCSVFCSKILAISNSVRNLLIKRGIKPAKVALVYNGIDKSNIINLPEPQILQQNSGIVSKIPFMFANVGQFVQWKEQIRFLKAAIRVAKELPETGFLIVGDDIFSRNSAYKELLLHFAAHSPIADRIIFTGWQNDMEKIWPTIDCLVHTAEQEPFGRVIIEAMAHRIPVIAINANGPSEIIDNGKTGILVEPINEDELVNAMLKIACDYEYAKILGNQGYNKAIECFSAQNTASLVEKYYLEILDR